MEFSKLRRPNSLANQLRSNLRFFCYLVTYNQIMHSYHPFDRTVAFHIIDKKYFFRETGE